MCQVSAIVSKFNSFIIISDLQGRGIKFFPMAAACFLFPLSSAAIFRFQMSCKSKVCSMEGRLLHAIGSAIDPSPIPHIGWGCVTTFSVTIVEQG